MSVRGLRDALKSYVPNWLSNRIANNTGFKVLYTSALVLDVAMKATVEGIRSWFPGYPIAPPGKAFVDASSALPYIGRSRGILQGEAESNSSFASRLVGWLQTWMNAGSSAILVTQIQAYLANNPVVRVVDRAGNWTSIDQNGNVTFVQAAWNWDGTSNPERNSVSNPWWSDIWIIVYPCEWPITGTKLTALVGKWGTYTGGGTGHSVPRQAVSAILGLVAQWKGAHTYVQAIIWSYDSTLFVPGSPAAGDPDGTWGYWGKLSAGALIPSRTGANDGRVRYWEPPFGG